MYKIPLFRIFWDEKDLNAVNEVIKLGMQWAVGPNIGKFEDLLAESMGTKYAVVFNSGTSALHAALLAHGIGNGDEVIVPSFGFIATANAPLFVGAKTVFADIEKQTLGLDPESVNNFITDKTKAIIPIHFGGCPCKIKELREIADDNNLILIEDAAEAMGAMVKNKKVGAYGNSSVLSFCQNKIITTGEGGAVITNSRDIYEKMLLARSHGRLETEDYFSSVEPFDYITLGYNFRMSNITAALGISQISKIQKLVDMRRRNSEYYTKKLKSINDFIIPLKPPGDLYHVYQLYSVIADRRDELMKYLVDRGIMAKVYFYPIHLTHFYRKLGYNLKLPVTEDISQKILSLPMFPDLKFEEMDYIVDNIINFYRG